MCSSDLGGQSAKLMLEKNVLIEVPLTLSVSPCRAVCPVYDLVLRNFLI